jgi:hypothetical protein
MALERALSKKAALTLAQLASYDDLVTDALVDHVRSHPYGEIDEHTLTGSEYRCISGQRFGRTAQDTPPLVA